MALKGITTRSLATLKLGLWLTEKGARGEGRLQARRNASGVTFYFRYTAPDGRSDRYKIGSYAPKGGGKGLLSLKQAQEEASRLRLRYTKDRDLRAALRRDAHRAAQEVEQARLASAAQAAKRELTLGALLTAYLDHLRARGKLSVRSVEASFARNVRVPFPEVWATPVADVTSDTVMPVLERLAGASKLRSAGQLRSHLRAAFSAAIKARQDARASGLRRFALTTNPIRDLSTIEGSVGVRDRALSVAELRAYWKRISDQSDTSNAMLRFHLLTGGQRVEQLSRATLADFDKDEALLTLLDPKGRRTVPRRHAVPLVAEAIAAMNAMAVPRIGDFVFTATNGVTGARYHVAAARLRAVVAAMEREGELEKGPFTLGDLRRTVETRLAARHVSSDVRAQLQSHGLGGIQTRNYDRHDYLAEKRAALESLFDLLSTKSGSVVPIAGKSGALVRR